MPPSNSDDMPTMAAKPHRSLWEAAVVGHVQMLATLASRAAPAIYAWFRAKGATAEQAQAHTEQFFARILTTEQPKPEEEDVERFQDFLLQRLVAYVEAGMPQVDPGQAVRVPFNQPQAERRYLREAKRDPDDVFNRRWALGALELTVETLREEFTNDGKAALVPHLQQFLSFSGGEDKYADLAVETGMSVSALHVAVYRYRQRYREIVRQIVGDTVRNEGDVDSELTKLLVSAS